MDPMHTKNGTLSPAQRALALGLLLETVVPMLNRARAEGRATPGHGERGADGKAELWQALRCKCGELSSLVVRADDPGEAASYVLAYLPEHFEYVFEHLGGPRRRPAVGGVEWARQVASRNGSCHADTA
jgi:hypothetical protein